MNPGPTVDQAKDGHGQTVRMGDSARTIDAAPRRARVEGCGLPYPESRDDPAPLRVLTTASEGMWQ